MPVRWNVSWSGLGDLGRPGGPKLLGVRVFGSHGAYAEAAFGRLRAGEVRLFGEIPRTAALY